MKRSPPTSIRRVQDSRRSTKVDQSSATLYLRRYSLDFVLKIQYANKWPVASSCGSQLGGQVSSYRIVRSSEGSVAYLHTLAIHDYTHYVCSDAQLRLRFKSYLFSPVPTLDLLHIVTLAKTPIHSALVSNLFSTGAFNIHIKTYWSWPLIAVIRTWTTILTIQLNSLAVDLTPLCSSWFYVSGYVIKAQKSSGVIP